MKRGAGSGSFGAHLKGLREAAGFTQEELATIAGLSVHAVSALEGGERRRPQFDTLRALSAALDLGGCRHDAFVASAREPVRTAAEELSATAVPVPLTALLGRDAELHTVRQWLDGRAVRLVTLVGPGGVGKTRLALEIARATAADDTARVVFVPLAAAGNAALAAMAIAEGLGFSDITVSDLPRRARLACQDRATLLVLDNFEHVLDTAPLVSDLLMSVPPDIRAVMAVRRGNAIGAIRFVRESLTRILELQDKFAFVYALVPLASGAVLMGDDEWAARSLGARDAITERIGAALLDPSVNDLREQAERGARARLGRRAGPAPMNRAAARASAACSSKSMRRYPDAASPLCLSGGSSLGVARYPRIPVDEHTGWNDSF